MTFINDTDQLKIEDAVRQVELKTRGELVTVVTGASDDYDYIPYLWSALIALFGASLVFVLNFYENAQIIFIAQICGFIILTYVLRIPAVKKRLVPKAVSRLRASRFAREQFFTQRVHETKERSGILIFVSVAEQYVEIIADKGINDKIEQSQWQKVVDQFVADVETQNVGNGFVTAINACGEKLATHFPIGPNDKNELPNRLVVL